MNESLQQQVLRTFKEHLGGLYTPQGLLAALGLRLGVRTPLRTSADLLRLTDEQAQAALSMITKIQRPRVAIRDIIAKSA